MTISQPTTMLSKPEGDARIPVGTLGYFQARNRARLYDRVLEEFEKSGLSKVTIAHRLGKDQAQINRLLGAPGNWTLDTVSDVLFAISGAEIEYDVCHPLDVGHRRNHTSPDWLRLQEDTLLQIPSSAPAKSTRSAVFNIPKDL